MGRFQAAIGAVVLGGAAAVCGACGAGEAGGTAATAFAIDTVGGVERWVYAGTGGPSLNWSTDTLAVLGGAMVDDDAFQFNNVQRDGLASHEGRLYVIDGQGKRVLVYDSLGGHVATHGREGGGPGELQYPVSIDIGAGDSIWVADIGNQRYTIFPPGGGDGRSLPFPGDAGAPNGHLAMRDGDLIQVLRPSARQRLMERRQGESAPEPPRPILRLDADGAVLDTLWVSQPPAFNEAQSGGATSGRRIIVRTTRVFEPDQAWRAFADGGIVVSDTAEYVLRFIDADGTVRRRIDRALPARATTEADKEHARELLRERMSGGGGMRITFNRSGPGGGAGAQAPPGVEELLEAQFAAMTFAPVIPRVTGIRIDHQDRVWVGVSLDTPGDTERIDIYDRDGNLLGELTGWALPDAFLSPSLAVSITEDEYEVQQLLIYRISEGESAADA